MRFLAVLFLTLSLIGSPALAQNALDMRSFENMPIQHEGRLKPLDSFAHITLKQLSGQSSVNGLSAIDWLALSIFDPQMAVEMPVFNIPSSALRSKLGLSNNKEFLSFTALKPALDNTRSDIEALLQKDTDALTRNEQDLLMLHENAATLTILMRSFTALLPLDAALPERYQTQLQDELTFTQLTKIEQQLQQEISVIVATKGANPANYSPEELNIAKAGFHIQALRAGGENNTLLRIIPSGWENNKDEWFSPWSIVLQGQGSPASAFLLSQWGELAKAYRSRNESLWRLTSADILEETKAQSENQVSLKRFHLERIYVDWKPYLWVLGLYSLSLFAAAFILLKPGFLTFKTPIICASTGIMLHISALVSRTYILDRPPVGTLYESILFVTLICTLIAVITSIGRKNLMPLIAGLAAAIGLLLTAPMFAPTSDSLEVLVAVLNTNFWLTTHVLVITAGYGVCILGACLAHGALYIRAFKNDGALWLKLQQSIYHISIAALLLTTLGTVLGGIWADQSWGRFWGWDPKENGALLIVLWLIWALHGRASAKLKPAGFMAIIATLNIVVAVSWFGVNLLNVGLHSYGFTSGLAGGLFAFCLIETLMIAGLYIAAKKKRAK